MFTKLKMVGLVFIVVFFLISAIASVIGTYRVTSALDELQSEKIKVAEEGASRTAIAELTSRVTNAEKTSKESISRIDVLKEEVAKKNSTVYITRVTETVVPNGGVVNENTDITTADDIGLALRAIDELWLDFCKKFPSEPRCVDRKDNLSEM